jgi:poly(A) polymerase
MLSKRMDELEARIAELAKEEEIAALRPEMDGAAVMEYLGVKPGRQVGAALEFLMEIRLEDGVLGDVEIRRRLDEWWKSQSK